MGSMTTRRNRSSAGTRLGALVSAVVLATTLSGCGDGDGAAATSTSTSTSTTSTSSTTVSTTTSTTTTAAPSTTTTQATPSTAPPVTAIPTDQNGRVFALIEGYDSATRTLTVDVAQYLGGMDYFRHLAADPSTWSDLYCDSTGSEYDGSQDLADCGTHGQDQTAINENPKLRTLSLAPDARFAISDGASGATFPSNETEFASFVARSPLGNTYWLEVRDGWVTSVEFQFFS